MNRNSSGRRYDREFKNNAVALVRGGRTITELPARSSQRGDVWQVDMGIAGKVRPCLLLTDYPADDELAMVTVLPHTTAVKGNRWELNIPKPFLKPGAFHFQQIQSISVAYLMRRLGAFTVEELDRVTDMLCQRLGC